MQAGKLRHRLALKRRADVQSDTGEVVPTGQLVAHLFAAVEPLSGRELFAAQQVQSEATYRIRIRYRAGVDSTHYLVQTSALTTGKLGNDVYDILHVAEDKQSGRSELNLLCVKRGTEGWRSGV